MEIASTIIAVSSAPGPSALGLIRLSGVDVSDVLAPHVGERTGRQRGSRVEELMIGEWSVPCRVLDMPGPASYTGQDVVEIQLPGNPVLLEEVVELLVASGVSRGLATRRALAGEFTFRAWRAGRLSLDRAESVAMLIAARSDEELAAAKHVFDGGLGAILSPVGTDMASLLASIEAGIDFADEEDVTLVTVESVLSELDRIRVAMVACCDAHAGHESPVARPRIVLRGPANAGKSTLFNALLQQDRVIVHGEAGTTRDAIAEEVALDGIDIVLVDTPGDEAGRSSVAGHAELEADVIVWCDPSGGGPSETLRIRTKKDLGTHDRGSDVSICALDRDDVARAAIAIAEAARQGRPTGGTQLSLSARQRLSILAAVSDLADAISLLEGEDPAGAPGHPAELAALLRLALDQVGSVTGEIPPEDVLSIVFAGFCIGK